jgi:hypothetical protein
MSETRVVEDLAIGDTVQVKGFDDPLVVRSAKKVQKGMDAGKLDVKLAGPDGTIETVRFDPEEAVVVVGKDADRGQPKPKQAGKGKAKVKAKGAADQGKARKGKGEGGTPKGLAEESANAEVSPPPEAQPEPAVTDAAAVTATQTEVMQAETTAVEAPQAGGGTPEPAPAEAAPAEASPPVESTAADTPAPEPIQQNTKPRRARSTKVPPDADGKPAHFSALSAAAKVLEENGQPMSAQELVEAMAGKGYWTSPAGKTPAQTLVSAMLREIALKGNEARFVKPQRGRFAIRQLQG